LNYGRIFTFGTGIIIATFAFFVKGHF